MVAARHAALLSSCLLIGPSHSGSQSTGRINLADCALFLITNVSCFIPTTVVVVLLHVMVHSIIGAPGRHVSTCPRTFSVSTVGVPKLGVVCSSLDPR